MLEDLRRERDDLHEVLRAQFAGDGPENTGAARIVRGVDDDDGVAVEAEVAAVGATDRSPRANDDRFRDLALFDGGIAGALLDVHGDNVADVGGRGPLTHALDESGFASAGIVG